MKPRLTFLLVFSMSFIFILATEVLAQDYLTDTGTEPVCDSLLDETRGLFGLCLGFCEALNGETTIAVEEPTTYPEGANKLIFEKFSEIAGENGPEMPCVEYIYGECPYWTVSPGFKDQLTSMISQMDDITVAENRESDTRWNIFRITGTINGEPEIIELKGAKEGNTFHFPLVTWVHYPPNRTTYFPGHHAEAYQYEKCKYDLEQMLIPSGECPYWTVSPALKDQLASMISQMDDITVEEDETATYYYFRITGTINGEPEIIELKGEKEENGLVFPLVIWVHYPPNRTTYFPGHNADKSQYARCAYDLEQVVY
ncbi:MAG: hypothetical protein QTN59_08485 [Candidatus Electrothrix communis]|nr:MAG: hypothetical protein QTN59_08485 [Candidatus Electrothrix communis]